MHERIDALQFELNVVHLDLGRADANNRKRESPQKSQQAEGHREEQDRMKQVDVSLSPTHTAFCRQDEEPAYAGHD